MRWHQTIACSQNAGRRLVGRRLWLLLLGLLTVGSSSTLAEGVEGYRVEVVTGLPTESPLADSIRTELAPSGVRLLDASGATLCELWLRGEIPLPGEEVAGASFSKIGEGSFVGVIHFPKSGGDFRGQGLKAGWYTMRYALILQDGNHLGVSPSRDFLLFSPVAEDPDPTHPLSIQTLYQKSRAAAGSGHPSSWSLVYPTEETGLPRVVTNHEEHVILELILPTAGTQTAVGLIVIGKTEG
jgi:hypothetical protein